MQTYGQKLSSHKFLLISLVGIAALIVISNLLSEDVASAVGHWSYVPVVGSLVILSLIITSKSKLKGSHGTAWTLFTIFAVSWFIAELLWSINEVILDIDPYPSNADYFYVLGYPLYFAFMIFYLKPFRKLISKKLVAGTSIAAIALLVPSVYLAFDDELGIADFENILGLSYPVGDAIIFATALIGISLFFKGKVNFLWTAMSFGIICLIIADTAFLFIGVLDDVYYVGHPIEILFLWTYLLLAFGVYENIKIFQIKKLRTKN